MEAHAENDWKSTTALMDHLWHWGHPSHPRFPFVRVKHLCQTDHAPNAASNSPCWNKQLRPWPRPIRHQKLTEFIQPKTTKTNHADSPTRSSFRWPSHVDNSMCSPPGHQFLLGRAVPRDPSDPWDLWDLWDPWDPWASAGHWLPAVRRGVGRCGSGCGIAGDVADFLGTCWGRSGDSRTPEMGIVKSYVNYVGLSWDLWHFPEQFPGNS